MLKGSDYVIAAIGAVSGGTVSVVIIQEAALALALGLATVAVFPVLIAALQGLVDFPLTSIILCKEALRLRDAYRAGDPAPVQEEKAGGETQSRLPAAFQSTVGTLFVVGVTVLVARFISEITNGNLNTFVAALILVFGRLATVTPDDLRALALPLSVAFLVGVAGIVVASVLVGKQLGFSAAMSIGIGLTALYGFPGTLLLSQEAAKAVSAPGSEPGDQRPARSGWRSAPGDERQRKQRGQRQQRKTGDGPLPQQAVQAP